jgi:hypothetical protein
MNICSRLCNECPFSDKSINGWLADYKVEDFKTMMDQEVMFPCHMTMKEEDLTIDEAQEKIINREIKLCRGYMESMIKSAKMPKFNKYLLEARAKVKEEGVSDSSMSIHNFIKYHTI